MAVRESLISHLQLATSACFITSGRELTAGHTLSSPGPQCNKGKPGEREGYVLRSRMSAQGFFSTLSPVRDMSVSTEEAAVCVKEVSEQLLVTTRGR